MPAATLWFRTLELPPSETSSDPPPVPNAAFCVNAHSMRVRRDPRLFSAPPLLAAHLLNVQPEIRVCWVFQARIAPTVQRKIAVDHSVGVRLLIGIHRSAPVIIGA